ncbi:serine hydrolase [Zeaxanthinibacter sp. PT1]|uniref:serine hydrolase n=1 Tax=Zeaxanthinibacter TaxID=561554 RepID=UPI00234BD4A6|nr:serine hydrolase [Zeaxanthinibacter sp. PT1]MDC6350484.1 serine hydrolase [Zeaxanthinibacter sp. PT1]
MKLAVLCLGLFLFLQNGNAQADPRLKNLDKEFKKILEVTKTPGFSVAVVEKDKVILSGGYGYRDVEKKIPVDQNTLFAIGSCSKAFTGALLGLLRQEGKLDFDDNPRDYIPELRFYNSELNNNVTIKDLMTHQTGIPRHDLAWYLFPTQSKDSLIQRIQYLEPFTGLRQKWHYNNFMYLVQGVIAERITGKSWEQNIQERFFDPLEMTRSNLTIGALKESENTAVGYELVQDSIFRPVPYYDIAAMGPAGSINSSAREMTQWLLTWVNKGKHRGKQLIPENYVTEAMSSHAVSGSGMPSSESPYIHNNTYGYGWGISSYRGHYRVGHSGGIDGFNAYVALYPTDSIGIVILANRPGTMALPMVRNLIADRMLQLDKIDWISKILKNSGADDEAEEETPKEIAGTIAGPTHDLADYTGTFHHPGYGGIKVSVRSDSLILKTPHGSSYLKPQHYDVFQPIPFLNNKPDTVNIVPFKTSFSMNETGEIASVKMKLERTLDQPIEFTREYETVEIPLATLQVYEGSYELPGIAVRIFLKGDGLVMFVPGQREYDLIPLDQERFAIGAEEGFFAEFVSDDNGTIKQLRVIQPNGTFIAKRK